MFMKALQSVLGVASERTRLIIEYILVGLLVASLAGSLTLYISKLKQDLVVANLETQVGTLNGKVTGLENVNRAQELDIDELKQLRYIDAEALGKLVQEVKKVSTRDAEFRAKLAKLEAEDETVREYLNDSIPPQLRCVLERTCEPAAGVPKAGTRTAGAASTVPSSDSGG